MTTELLADLRAFVEAHKMCGPGDPLTAALALLARIDAEAGGWRSIESAPKRGKRVMIGLWNDKGEWEQDMAGWNKRGWLIGNGLYFGNPTHWRDPFLPPSAPGDAPEAG